MHVVWSTYHVLVYLSPGRSELWTNDMLWEPCIRCSWAHPGKSIYWVRGERRMLYPVYRLENHWGCNFGFDLISTHKTLFFHEDWWLPACSTILFFLGFLIIFADAWLSATELWNPGFNTWSWNIAVWCVNSRLMFGVWEYCYLPCSVDIYPLMMTTAWSSTERLQ